MEMDTLAELALSDSFLIHSLWTGFQSILNIFAPFMINGLIEMQSRI